MKIFILFFSTFIGLFAFAQEKGMKFEHNSTWDKVVAKAKQENKYIFVDCYTTWCGPCKMMTSDIFPKEQVGTFYNANFVSIKLQFDETAEDNEEIVSWRTTAQDFEKKYAVKAYPTYLIFNPSGQLVHQFVGAYNEKEFIEKGKDALLPEKQYFVLKNNYSSQKGNPAFLYQLTNAAIDAYDIDYIPVISKEYLATQKDLYTKENLELIGKSLQSTKEEAFKVLTSNPNKVDKVLGKPGMAKSLIKQTVLNDIIYPKIYEKETVNWKSLESKIKAVAPSFTAELLHNAKMINAQKNENWTEYSTLAVNYLKKYNKSLNGTEINAIAWTIFENCNDKACINTVLNYSKNSFAKDNNPMYIDTYANLLYKLGKKKEAIDWQKKAIQLLKDNGESTSSYEATLAKMEKGEKTW